MVARGTYQIGELNERITISRETLTETAMGGQTVAVATVFNDWALVRPMRVSEGSADGKLQATGGYIFTIRNQFTPLPTDRITWRGETYNIRGIMTRGQTAGYIEIEAERGVAL